MQFSTRFKQLCKEHGVTQKKALEDMGFHRNAVQSWNSGNPSADALKKLAAYFDMTTDDLLGVETKKEQPTDFDGLSDKRKALIEFALSVPEDKADLLLQVMKTILQND